MSLLNISNEIENKLSDISSELHFISSSFYSTGNEYMGNKLINIANSLNDLQSQLNESINDDIRSKHELAQQSYANTINTALVMSKLSKESKWVYLTGL